MISFNPSPITCHHFGDLHFYLKRDELLHDDFSGNKARKFMTLLENDWPNINTLISYGSAQANACLSLAALAQLKQWRFEFYVDHLPAWLKVAPIGNYQAALSLGAQLFETNAASIHPRDYIEKIRQPASDCLVVPEGGHSPWAQQGVHQLAMELIEWIDRHPVQHPVIVLPSGTGTTSGFLAQSLHPYGISVLTCACVGHGAYLQQQWAELGLPASQWPMILNGQQTHHFGKLSPPEYDIWHQLQEETGVTFDLLYDPYMWLCLAPWQGQHPDATIIYVHQGGLKGNESMKLRYERKRRLRHTTKPIASS